MSETAGENASAAVPRPGRIGYEPALDGFRGLGLLWMFGFHAGFPWAIGGFLGISGFFTLSGFLITSLFLAEKERSGAIDLRAFWARRLRRLMPAALLGLAAVSISALAFATPDQLSRLRGDVLAALAYVANWRFLLSDTAYTRLFEAPSLLQHFWSLAIEEQYYFVYPVIVFFALGTARGSRRRLGIAVSLLFGLSLLVSLALQASGASIDRLYYGTDTRGLELLAGCGLAIVSYGRPPRATWLKRMLREGSVVPFGAMIFLWTTVDLKWRWLYPGGLLAYSLLSIWLFAAAVQPGSPVRWILSQGVLRWLGQVSYGAYVFHWPLFLWLSPERTGLDAWPLFALRIALSLMLAAASYRYFESPIRRGSLLTGARAAIATPLAVAVVALLAIGVTRNASIGGVDLEAQHQALEAEQPPAADPAQARPAAPSRLRDRPRVAVFGDSTALTINLALARTLRAQRRALPVAGMVQMGCGLAVRGEYRFRGRELLRPTRCGDRATLYGERIATARPDIALVLFGPWDVLDRRLWDDAWRAPGDPELDAYLKQEMLAATDLLASDGALVIWLTSPRILVRELETNRVPDPPYPASDPARMDRYNALVRSLEQARPGVVRVLDFAGYLARHPDGEFDPAIRPDGIHLSEDGARRVAEEWLADALLALYRQEGDRFLTAP